MSYEEFLRDEKTRDAVVRNLEITGKDAKNIPDKFKENHTEEKWREMAGMREKVSHGALFWRKFIYY